MKRTTQGDELSVFANALRNYLGLAPYRQVGLTNGQRRRAMAPEIERFYQLPPVPFATPKRLPGNG